MYIQLYICKICKLWVQYIFVVGFCQYTYIYSQQYCSMPSEETQWLTLTQLVSMFRMYQPCHQLRLQSFLKHHQPIPCLLLHWQLYAENSNISVKHLHVWINQVFKGKGWGIKHVVAPTSLWINAKPQFRWSAMDVTLLIDETLKGDLNPKREFFKSKRNKQLKVC